MDKDELLKIIEDDEHGLLNVKPKGSANTSDERLIARFQDICDFVREFNRLPEANRDDMREMQLFTRLNALRQDAAKCEILKSHDELKLLGEPKKIVSIDDIFEDDDLGLLQDPEDNIFTLKNVPKPKEVTTLPEYIAKRRPCVDFNAFEHLFEQVQHDLSLGIRKLSKFTKGTQVGAGQFFVLRGMVVYVASEHQREDTPGAELGRMNDRLRCIFENGTESDMLRRSLSARLYEQEGQRVSETPSKLHQMVNEITDDDQQTGFVYVLKSLSQKPEIKSLKNLYKIGFCRGAVEERIRNASQDATYLMAPVAIVTTYQCYNFNPQKLELLLHTFFGRACLQIEIVGAKGIRCQPKEWFLAPLAVVNSTIELLISGEISKYKYDEELQMIVTR